MSPQNGHFWRSPASRQTSYKKIARLLHREYPCFYRVYEGSGHSKRNRTGQIPANATTKSVNEKCMWMLCATLTMRVDRSISASCLSRPKYPPCKTHRLLSLFTRPLVARTVPGVIWSIDHPHRDPRQPARGSMKDPER